MVESNKYIVTSRLCDDNATLRRINSKLIACYKHCQRVGESHYDLIRRSLYGKLQQNSLVLSILMRDETILLGSMHALDVFGKTSKNYLTEAGISLKV